MGSEGPKAVTIHVTGFKKFQGVAENPTESIVILLKGEDCPLVLLLEVLLLLRQLEMVPYPCFTRPWNQASQELQATSKSYGLVITFHYATPNDLIN
jgi:pyrrolidone-carboxylate peptidase